MRPLLILVTGEPVAPVLEAHGSFVDAIRQTVGRAWPGLWTIVDVRSDALPAIENVAGVIVTGSHASVTELSPWMESTAVWLCDAVRGGSPVLGLCFGHQLLGHAMGGEVRRLPGGPETGTVRLELLSADELVGPATGVSVNMLHEDSVVRLPPGASVLARTAREPHAAVRFGRLAWGVQFHPELDGSIVRSYLEALRDKVRRPRRDPEPPLPEAADTPWAANLLRRFATLALTNDAARGRSQARA